LKNGLFVRLIFIIDHFSSPSEVDNNQDVEMEMEGLDGDEVGRYK
jgi:hypothetical protein